MIKSEIYAAFTEMIIANLENCGSGQQMWRTVSPVSLNGHIYRGINRLMLANDHFQSQVYGTFQYKNWWPFCFPVNSSTKVKSPFLGTTHSRIFPAYPAGVLYFSSSARGYTSDQINILLATTAYNMMKWMRIKQQELLFFQIRAYFRMNLFSVVNIQSIRT